MKQGSNMKGREVYIVDGKRTPFLKARGIGPFTGADLAVEVGKRFLLRWPFLLQALDEVIMGSVMPDEANIARVISLRLGFNESIPAYTVMRNCASGMQAIDAGAIQIASGRSDLILAGGTEAMSHAPLLFRTEMALWLSRWYAARSIGQKAQLLVQLKPSYFIPVLALLRGLTDPLIGLNMGQTAEKVAHHFNITRDEMDQFALESHQRLNRAVAEGRLSEIMPIIDKKGRYYANDDGLRADTTLEKLGQLKPYFDKKYGKVTAGNSSQVSDGACLLLLASAEAVKKYDLPILGRIVDVEWAALDPSQMGLGPVHAATPIMLRNNLKPNDFDCWEINEAFAAQVLGCLKAFEDKAYSKQHFGLDTPLGAPDISRVNQDGGAIAMGHPVGASGARIVLHTLEILKQKNGKRGMATICIGGGQGGAMYLERVTEVRT